MKIKLTQEQWIGGQLYQAGAEFDLSKKSVIVDYPGGSWTLTFGFEAISSDNSSQPNSLRQIIGQDVNRLTVEFK